MLMKIAVIVKIFFVIVAIVVFFFLHYRNTFSYLLFPNIFLFPMTNLSNNLNQLCFLVALKKINVDIIDETTREKCLKEVLLLQSLDHPNIVHYMEYFLSSRELIIVVEWAAAGDLKRQLRKVE